MGKSSKMPGVFRWGGLLGEATPTLRLMVFMVLVFGSLALTIVQFGFVEIGFEKGQTIHLILLLQPVALAALLFGVWYSTVLGFIAGAALYAHSLYLPLDYYELTFVNQGTSMMMLTVVGFLLGVFFALALRSDPPIPKRIVRLTIICFAISAFYSLAFLASATFSFGLDLANSAVVEGVEEISEKLIAETATRTVMRLGDMGMQALLDALLMLALCLGADALSRRAVKMQKALTIGRLFNAWLFVVVLLAFLVTVSASFVTVTLDERARAAVDMQDEIVYLCNQIEDAESRSESFGKFLESQNINYEDISPSNVGELAEALSFDDLLNGYTEEGDGLVIISHVDGDVILCDVEGLPEDATLESAFGDDVTAGMRDSLSTGELQRVIYDGVSTGGIDLESLSERVANTQIAFLMSQRTGDYDVTIVMPAHKVFALRSGVMAWTAISALVVLLVVYILVSKLLKQVVVNRIDEMNGVLGRITQGDLEARVEVDDTTELKSLSSGINETVDALKGWISEAETRMDAELATAKAIQEAALPRIFPPFPDILHFDIYATMRPAREVGGDFYDFFLIGEDSDLVSGKLGFLIADVSGKGVPAALFMMAAKTVIRDYMESGMELGEAFENANHQLCDGNDADMFVTAFAGVLDYGTGHIDYVSAGHNPPLLWQRGAWRWLREKSGLPLGIFDGLPYKAYSLDCQIGDQLLLYTDGVTEAMDTNGSLYGEDRLERLVVNNYDLHPRKFVDTVRRDVARYAEGAEQSDDITILALEVGVPPEVTATLVVPARVEELTAVNEFIHTELDRRLCPLRAQIQLDVAVEELFVNVCSYAYPNATPERPGTVRVSYTYSADPPSIKVDIVDDGIPYDPLAKPDAVTPDNIMDVPIGGLGILMAKRSVNSMSYERVDGSNIVSIVKKW